MVMVKGLGFRVYGLGFGLESGIRVRVRVLGYG
jgi:hypothetical protein